MGVIFTALLLMAFIMVSSLSAVGYSRQRTEATALANQALEQIRALPASQLYMSSTDLSDPQLVTCGSATCFGSSPARTVPVANFGPNPATTPLTPTHVTTATALPGNTVYTIKSYLTTDPTDATGHTLVATVQVSWSKSQKGGVAASLQVESKIYNAQFNETPPAVHTFTASAQGSPGSISITGTILGQALTNTVFNLPSSSAAMNGSSLPNSTNVGASGSPAVSAGVAQSGVKAGAVQVLNTPTASASASSTPALNTSGTGQTNSASPTLLSLSSAVNIDTGVLTSVGSTNNATAVAASANNGGVPYAGAPALPNPNGLGYGKGTATQTGPAGASVDVGSNLGLPVLGIGLVKLIPTGNANPDYSTVTQNGTSAQPQLQTFQAVANQQFTELDVVNLSLLGIPLNTLLKLTGFQETAAACAGPVACTPAAQVDSGSIQILNGTSYPIQSLLTGVVPLATVNNLLLQNVPLGAITVGITGTGITLGSNQTPGSVGSPLTINLNVDASLLGVSLVHVTINVNLGSVQASASYS